MNDNKMEAESLKMANELKEQSETQINKFKVDLAVTLRDTYLNCKKRNKSFGQREFAIALGCSQPRVSNIINLTVDSFTVDKLLTLCAHVGINPIINSKPLKRMNEEASNLIDAVIKEKNKNKKVA